jgi:uncharacterized membrane protein YkoI
MKKHLIPAIIAALFLTPAAFAAGKFPDGNFEKAMKAALAKHPGEVLTVEAELNKGKPQYEFDIKSVDGKEWEVEVDAKTGKVIEEEQEVADANDAVFKSKAKVTQEDAKKTALAKYPGEVVESEFSIESDGNPSYEFDIKMKDGKEMEVEVDAATGKINDEEEEIWQIGGKE